MSTTLTVFRPFTSTLSSGDELVSHKLGMNTTEVSSGWKVAEAIVVLWQSSDLSLFDPPYASALASRLKLDFNPTGSIAITPSPSASPASTSAIPEPTTTMPETQSKPTLGLSPSARAGVIASAVCGAAFLAAIVFFLYRYLRGGKASNDPDGNDNETGDTAPELLDIQSPAYSEKYRNEHGDIEISELPSPVPETGKRGDDGIIRTMREFPSPVAESEGGKVEDRGGTMRTST